MLDGLEENINVCDTVPGAAKKLKMPENHAQEEMETFKKTAPMPIRKEANPLNWWREHECEYPLLSKLTKRYLCIPRTSVSSERVFSTAGDIITAQRSALNPEHLDQILFLNKNLKTNQVRYKFTFGFILLQDYYALYFVSFQPSVPTVTQEKYC